MKKLNDIIQVGFFKALHDEVFKVGVSNWWEQFDFSKDLISQLNTQSGGAITDINFLDDEYLANIGGKLIASELLLQQVNNNGLITLTSQWQKILKVVYVKYKSKWDKLWAVTKEEYNPIENYDMVERETLPTKTTKENTSKTYHNEQNEKVNNAIGTYGFNSPTKVPMDESELTRDKLQNYQDTTETGLATDNYVEESYNTYRELSKHGNIGVTTSQQMIESEIALWQWNFIENVIYNDLNEILSIQMYESNM